MIVRCPVCEHETLDPEPDWIATHEVIVEVCEACEREFYADEAAIP